MVLMKRRFVAILVVAVSLIGGMAGTAFADQPASRPPADRGKAQPPCTLGLELGGSRTCIVP